MDTTRVTNAGSRRSLVAWLRLLLVPTLLRLLANSARAQDASGSATRDHCAERFLDPLFAIAATQPSEPSASFDARLAATLGDVRRLFPSRIETVIATIADPIDAGMGYQFDTSLAALRLGVESALKASPRVLAVGRPRAA